MKMVKYNLLDQHQLAMESDIETNTEMVEKIVIFTHAHHKDDSFLEHMYQKKGTKIEMP